MNVSDLPTEDTNLTREITMRATGADIHEINGELGIYRNALGGARRRAAMLKSGNYTELATGPTLAEDLAWSIDMVRKYETKLRVRLAQMRLSQGQRFLPDLNRG